MLGCLFVFLSFIAGSSALKCYQCTSMNGDCTNGQCEGVWCVEQMVRGSGKVMVKKDCSPANNLVSGKEECLKSSLDGAETVNCICNQDLCNNVDYLKRFPAFSTDNSGNLSGTLPQNLLTTGGQTDSNIIGSSSGALPGISCYQCSNQTGDCKFGRCTGSWCLATVIKKDDGSIGVTKDCLRDSVLTKTKDDCINQHLTAGYTSHTCTCRTTEMCNSREYLDQMYSQQNGGNFLFGPSQDGFNFNNTSRSWTNSGATLPTGTQSRVRCYCSADLHGKAQCDSANSCYGEACVSFNGTVHESTTNRTSPLVFHSCELSIKNLQQGPNLHFPYCETTNYMDDTVSGHVQISGQSCYCATEICNHPQNTRSFKFTSGPNILNGNTVNDPSWQPSQSNINVDLNQDRTDRTGQPEFNRQTPLSQSNTHLNQIHPANLSSRMAVCSIFLTSLLMVTSIF